MKRIAPAVFSPYRRAVASRVMASLVGGYLLASLSSIALAELLPLARADAVITGMMLSFVFYATTVIACFACRTATRAWAGVLAGVVLVGSLCAWVHWIKHL